MKKNLLTIIIFALGLLNMVLTSVVIFTVVPTTIKTNNLITKVASAIDLELESPLDDKSDDEISLEDTEIYNVPEDIIINLKKEAGDNTAHYASVSVSFSLNKKSEDFETLEPSVETNNSRITEIITDEFSKYTINNVQENKEKIKAEILKEVQEYFHSDFIYSVTVGKLVVE